MYVLKPLIEQQQNTVVFAICHSKQLLSKSQKTKHSFLLLLHPKIKFSQTFRTQIKCLYQSLPSSIIARSGSNELNFWSRIHLINHFWSYTWTEFVIILMKCFNLNLIDFPKNDILFHCLCSTSSSPSKFLMIRRLSIYRSDESYISRLRLSLSQYKLFQPELQSQTHGVLNFFTTFALSYIKKSARTSSEIPQIHSFMSCVELWTIRGSRIKLSLWLLTAYQIIKVANAT